MLSLRDNQKKLARDRILAALAEELVDVGLVELSVANVAKRAGVSLRTVYNHFENREALLSALSEHGEQVMVAGGGRLVEGDPDRMVDALAANFRLFSELDETLMRALFIVGSASDAPADRSQQLKMERTAAVTAMVESERPDLDPEQQRALALMMRTIASADTWRRLSESGLSGEMSGVVAGWAFRSLTESLRARSTPFD